MGVIQRQSIKNFITTYIGIIIGFVSLIWIQPNFLTKDELGLTRLLYSFSMLVAVFIPLGIGNATTKYFPLFKDEKKKHHGYLAFMMIFPVIGYLMSCVVLYSFKDFFIDQYRRESPLFIEFYTYVFPLTIIISLIACLNVYCYSNYKSTVPAFLNDVVARILVIAVITLYYMRWITFTQFISCYVALYGLQLILLFGYIFFFDKLTFTIDWKFFREKNFFKLINYGMLLWFAGVASIGLKYFDTIMIGKFMPLSFVAIYSIAVFIPTIIEAPLGAIERIAASKIAFAWVENNHKEILDIYKKSTLYMLVIGGLLFLGVNINIKTLFTFLPKGYEQGSIVVLILSISTLFNMATGLNAPILFNSEKYKYGAVFLISLAVIALIFQMLFIPLFGLEGAALATAGASVSYNLALYFFVWKNFQLQPFDSINIKIVLLIVSLFLFNYLLPTIDNRYFDIAYRSAIITMLYVGAVYVLKIIPEFHKYLPWIKNKKSD
ncbi:MAG: polysaccharide biosynthesis C-terminal domain-containing protein [Bacteroidia bacterium]